MISRSITIQLNGDPHTVAENTTVSRLLEELDMGGGAVAVEINRAIVPRANHPLTVLRDEDEIEIVTAVGGG